MSFHGPLLLAIESATQSLSVALLRGSDLVAERAAPPGPHHAERLLPLIEELLAAAGCREAEVEAFGVSIGPGSFTSLRVGLATVKGLAFATERRAVAVPTLAALAWGYATRNPERDPSEPIVAVLDARRDELYAAAYVIDEVGAGAGVGEGAREAVREQGATGLYTPAELRERLPARCVLVGDGIGVYQHAQQVGLAEPPGVRVSGDLSAPTAASVGALAALALRRGEDEDPADLVPRYVRRAEAEVTRTSLKTE